MLGHLEVNQSTPAFSLVLVRAPLMFTAGSGRTPLGTRLGSAQSISVLVAAVPTGAFDSDFV